jgi:hypothetical protein
VRASIAGVAAVAEIGVAVRRGGGSIEMMAGFAGGVTHTREAVDALVMLRGT